MGRMFVMPMPAKILLSLSLAVAACGEEPVCVSGETQACLCAGARPGAQVCLADRTGWSVCVCGTGSGEGTNDPSDEEDPKEEPDEEDPIVTIDPSLVGNPVAGGALFSAHCASCHSIEQGRHTIGPDLYEEVPEEDDEELWEIILAGEDEEMPPTALSGQQTADLVAYLRATFGAYVEED